MGNVSTCPTTRTKALFVAVTSPARPTFHGRPRRTKTGLSRMLRRSETSTKATQACRPTTMVIVYCRIGERSSHTWFVLTNLLGYSDVKNYDGSWTEWGNSVGVPDREVVSAT